MTLHELVFNRDGTITERIEVTHKIQVHDEDGNKVEKETPKNEFIKKKSVHLPCNTGEKLQKRAFDHQKSHFLPLTH